MAESQKTPGWQEKKKKKKSYNSNIKCENCHVHAPASFQLTKRNGGECHQMRMSEKESKRDERVRGILCL